MNPVPPPAKERLIVVSNRLPFTCKRHLDGQWQITPGSGGLVTALLPVLRNRGGTWIRLAGHGIGRCRRPGMRPGRHLG